MAASSVGDGDFAVVNFLAFVPRLDEQPLVETALCDRGAVNHRLAFPFAGNDITRLAQPIVALCLAKIQNAHSSVHDNEGFPVKESKLGSVGGRRC